MEKNAAIHSSDLFFDDTIVTSNDNQALVQQIIELRCALDDESQNYKRKLQHYEESQERQAQVVLKLQQKVLQYKAKCSELEFNLESKNTELERYKAIKVVCCCGF
jgi:rootletin